MNKEELYKTILNSPTHKYPLLNEIYAIRNTKLEKEDYTIGVNGFISLSVLLENYNQINMLQDLQHQLEEKDKIIYEAIKYIKDNLIIASILDGKTTYCLNPYSFDYEKLLEILTGGKNVNSK